SSRGGRRILNDSGIRRYCGHTLTRKIDDGGALGWSPRGGSWQSGIIKDTDSGRSPRTVKLDRRAHWNFVFPFWTRVGCRAGSVFERRQHLTRLRDELNSGHLPGIRWELTKLDHPPSLARRKDYV